MSILIKLALMVVLCLSFCACETGRTHVKVHKNKIQVKELPSMPASKRHPRGHYKRHKNRNNSHLHIM